MINAWSLAHDVLNGTLDEEYPIMSQNNKVTPLESDEYDPIHKDNGLDAIERMGGFEYTPGSPWPPLDPDDPKNYPDFRPDKPYVYESPDGGKTVTRRKAGSLETEVIKKPEPNLDFKPHKYGEDKGIEDLKSYVSSTYNGHYTSDQNNTQTLDLIQSVGDAESFCRSNAIKYLARYDRKGQAKNDILKAMHYCLLLYYFSGNTQDPDYTNSRYETF